jgi:transketolase
MSDAVRSCTWDAFCEYIINYAQSCDDFVLVAHDVDYGLGLLKELPPEKILRSSASDSNMILNAAGLALNGKKPWIAGNSSMIVGRSYAQIREMLAMPSLRVKIAVADGGLSRGQEPSGQFIEDLALMRAMPNMSVAVPSDRNSLLRIAKAVENVNGPAYLRLGQTAVPDLGDDREDSFHIGGARLLREGDGVTICCCGIMVHQALRAAEILEQQSINAEVIDCYSLKPFPEQILLSSVRRTGCCVVAEEHTNIGGLCSATAECLCRTYPVPVRFVAVDDQFVHSGMPEELREYFGLTWKEIVSAAAQVWALRRR